jgi:uncharacterized protein (DUF488 family)
MHQIYTTGYLGWTQDQLFAAVQGMNALLVDIRYSPQSRYPAWRVAALQQALSGDYVHLKALGNAAYKTGGMVIADYPAGLKFIAETVIERPLVLLCACPHPDRCHRTVVGEMLRNDGFAVAELERGGTGYE